MIVVGQSWSGTEEFSDFFGVYCQRTYQDFSKQRSLFRKDCDGAKIAGQYEKLTLVCVHGTKQETKVPTGARPIQSTFRKDCPAAIKLSYHHRTGRLTVSNADLEHNHEISDVLFKHYPRRRRLSEGQEERAKELLKIGTSARSVTDALALETGKALITKDIHNIRTKLKVSSTKGKTQEMILQGALRNGLQADPGLSITYSRDVHGNLEVLCLITSKMKDSFKR